MIKKSIALAIAASAMGLGSQAYAAEYEVTITNLTAHVYFTPVIVSAHSPDVAMFGLAAHASPELQAIAEGGDISAMAALLESVGASVGNSQGLLAPGDTATVTVNGSDLNSVLSLTSMLLPTNDGFLGLNSIALPNNGGETSYYFARGYDAGTEANDELVGSGAPGEPGFPAPPPVVASGTGTGGTGVPGEAEGFITVHRGVLGDLDPNGGHSDINAAVHRWNNPVARIGVTMVGGDNGDGPSAVAELSGAVYSSTALELFWQPAVSSDSVVIGYEVQRNGNLVASLDGLSFFEEGLRPGVAYTYRVRAIDANGAAGEYETIVLTTNAN